MFHKNVHSNLTERSQHSVRGVFRDTVYIVIIIGSSHAIKNVP